MNSKRQLHSCGKKSVYTRPESKEFLHEVTLEHLVLAVRTRPGPSRFDYGEPAGVAGDVLASGGFKWLDARFGASNAYARSRSYGHDVAVFFCGSLSSFLRLAFHELGAMLFIDGLVFDWNELAEERVEALRVLGRLEDATGNSKEVANVEIVSLYFFKF